MEILKVTQPQADKVGYIVTSFGESEGIPATARNKATFPDSEIVEVESEYTIDFFEAKEQEIVESWRKSASLSRRRFKIGEALYQVNGTPLVELIEALLAGLPEPQKTVATIAYNESGRFDRLDPFVLQFSQALEMSEEEVDEFFRYCIEEEWRNIQ